MKGTAFAILAMFSVDHLCVGQHIQEIVQLVIDVPLCRKYILQFLVHRCLVLVIRVFVFVHQDLDLKDLFAKSVDFPVDIRHLVCLALKSLFITGI